MPNQNQLWKARKQQARKLISQRDEAVTYNPETTLNVASYTVKIDAYTLHFKEEKGRITYLGEQNSKGQFVRWTTLVYPIL